MNDDKKDVKPTSTSSVIQEQNKSESYKVLHPSPRELPERTPLITWLTGKPPNMYTLVGVGAEEELADAIIEGRAFDPANVEKTAIVMLLKKHAPSLGRKGRAEIVEIAKSVEPGQHRSAWSRWRNRE